MENSIKPVVFLKLKALLHKWRELTTWERDFVIDLKDKKDLTKKQIQKVSDIYLERIKGVSLYVSCDHLSWDDVHDFDRWTNR